MLCAGTGLLDLRGEQPHAARSLQPPWGSAVSEHNLRPWRSFEFFGPSPSRQKVSAVGALKLPDGETGMGPPFQNLCGKARERLEGGGVESVIWESVKSVPSCAWCGFSLVAFGKRLDILSDRTSPVPISKQKVQA